MNKKTILILQGEYWPGYKTGGPVRSAYNMVEALGDQYDFRVIVKDRDPGDHKAYDCVKHDQWQPIGKGYVYYLRPEQFSLFYIRKIMLELDYDMLFLQGFFSPHTRRALITNLTVTSKKKPMLLAPRGEFRIPALRGNKRKYITKLIYLAIMKIFRITRKVAFYASSEDEKNDIMRVIGDYARVHVALNIPGQEHVSAVIDNKQRQQLKLVTLGRICSHKNQLWLLEQLAQTKAVINIDFYGATNDNSYLQAVKDKIDVMPDNIRAKYCGILPAHDVIKTLKEYDLFVLPTKSENYGHVIHEALRAGLPVITSDQTPWHMLEERSAGWEIPLDKPGKYRDIIETCAAMDADDFIKIRQNALQLGIEVAEDCNAINDHIAMFDALLKQHQ